MSWRTHYYTKMIENNTSVIMRNTDDEQEKVHCAL